MAIPEGVKCIYTLEKNILKTNNILNKRDKLDKQIIKLIKKGKLKVGVIYY